MYSQSVSVAANPFKRAPPDSDDEQPFKRARPGATPKSVGVAPSALARLQDCSAMNYTEFKKYVNSLAASTPTEADALVQALSTCMSPPNQTAYDEALSRMLKTIGNNEYVRNLYLDTLNPAVMVTVMRYFPDVVRDYVKQKFYSLYDTPGEKFLTDKMMTLNSKLFLAEMQNLGLTKQEWWELARRVIGDMKLLPQTLLDMNDPTQRELMLTALPPSDAVIQHFQKNYSWIELPASEARALAKVQLDSGHRSQDVAVLNVLHKFLLHPYTGVFDTAIRNGNWRVMQLMKEWLRYPTPSGIMPFVVTQLQSGDSQLDVPLLQLFERLLLKPPTYFEALQAALEGQRPDAVAWLLQRQPNPQVFADERFGRLLRTMPELKDVARRVGLPPRYIMPRLYGTLQRVQKRKFRERITRSQPSYKWEDVCAGTVDASDEELLAYATGLTAIVNDLQGRATDAGDVARGLTGAAQAAGTSLKRVACKRIAQLTEQYRALVEGIECDDLITESHARDIPIGQLITWLEGNNRYCFTPDELAQMDSNPYTRRPFPAGVKDRAQQYKADYGGWFFDKHQAARDEYMKDAAKYSALWHMLSQGGYAVSQSDYQRLSRQQVLQLDAALRASAGAFSHHDALERDITDSGDAHLALVGKLTNFLHQTTDPDFAAKALLVNELLAEAVNPSSVAVEY